MLERVTASEFDNRHELPDWRFLLERIDASFVAGTFEEAAAFVADVAAAAEEAEHHPDVDLRYPGRVHVALMTHAAGYVTGSDLELAARISDLASHWGLVPTPGSLMSVEVAIDALDIDAVRPFWLAVLDYVEQPAAGGGKVTVLVDPSRIGPSFWFQQMDGPRPQRNRLHIDVTVPHDVADDRVAAAIAAGGRLVTDRFARSFWVLADPEGNEACVCTWQDRD